MNFKISEPKLVVIGFDTPVTDFGLFLNGQLYYQRSFKTPTKGVTLNVNHTGIFSTDTKINYIEYFERKIFDTFIDKLPLPEKNINKKNIYKVYNSSLKYTPARIDVKTGRLEYGDYFLQQPIPIQEFILYHEIGHNYYTTETYCDQYALYQFCKNYGNPSQGYYALATVFKRPEYQLERINNIHRLIK